MANPRISESSTAANDIPFQPDCTCGDDLDAGPADGEYARVELSNPGSDKRESVSFKFFLDTLDRSH